MPFTTALKSFPRIPSEQAPVAQPALLPTKEFVTFLTGLRDWATTISAGLGERGDFVHGRHSPDSGWQDRRPLHGDGRQRDDVQQHRRGQRREHRACVFQRNNLADRVSVSRAGR
jgi:hypothetical protein